MAAETALHDETRRELYLDRRVCTATPQRIDIHPARSIVFLPLITLLLGLCAFPVIYFWGSSLSLELRLLLTFGAIILVPVAGIGLVYSIAGAHVVIERAKQSAVLQQGYLGMGVGTQELIPFWKIDRILVQELAPREEQAYQDEFVQYDIILVKISDKQISLGTVTVARIEAEAGLVRAREFASLVAEMAGTRVQETRAEPGPPQAGDGP